MPHTSCPRGWDVLVFQPGWSEIQETIGKLERMEVDAELLPFHSGQLERAEKDRVYKFYSRPKVIVATNALETGRTLPPSHGRKLAVISSGKERRIELQDEVETLVLGDISLAQRDQQKGRTGRMGEGVYVDQCPTSVERRSKYPVPEIYRTRLDQTVLRLAVAGYDATELSFYHEVDGKIITEAKQSLYAFGAMTEGGVVTNMGRKMARMRGSLRSSRMLIEAEKLGVVEDVLVAAAIVESGEITARAPDRYTSPKWKKLVASETGSDVMAQLAVYQQAETMSADEMRENGIFVKAFFQAKSMYRRLRDSVHDMEMYSTGRREDVLKAVSAGMVDHLFQNRSGLYRNGEGTSRELNRDSVVRDAGWIVGEPFNLEVPGRRGGKITLHLIRMATKVDPSWLVDIAPQLARQDSGLRPTYDAMKDVVVSTTQTFFNGQMVGEEVIESPDHPEASRMFVRWLAAQIG